MSQGFLLFAHNNDRINYGLLAYYCARRIKHFLDKPVTLAADTRTVDHMIAQGINLDFFDHVITSSSETTQVKRYNDELYAFQNLDRVSAWDLTPYEETIILDTDVLVQSTILNTLWGSDHSYIACDKSSHVLGITHDEFQFISPRGLKFFWATQFYFRKDKSSQLFFETCRYIKENYWWYASLYDFDSRLVRNDYIWSIAINLLGGGANDEWCPTMPWTLSYTLDGDQLISLQPDSIFMLFNNDNPVRLYAKDLHIMNKNSLQNTVVDNMEIKLL
jgi:hypothetical protein